MGLRDQLKRLKREMHEDMGSFELLDGSRYYFDPASFEIFLHYWECLKSSAHHWPEPPEVVRQLTEAKDVEQAISSVLGGGANFLVYDPEILIGERRLVPRGLVSSYDPDTGEHVTWDPYDERLDDVPDLSY
jgi:hypothetical protein